MTSRITPSALLLGCLMSLAACSGDAAPKPRISTDGGPGTDGNTDGGHPFFDPDGSIQSPPGETFTVIIQSDKVELCPGECAELAVRARESEGGELHYSWSDGLPANAGQRVCPEEATTYRVEVEEIIGAGSEFESVRTAQDELTISVKSCDPEDPVLCEARYRYDMPREGNVLRFSKPWLAPFGMESTLAADADGNVLMLASFGHAVDLGAGEVVATAGANGLIHKLDANCRPVWTRALYASIPSDVLIAMAMVTDRESNVYAIGIGGPLLFLDPLLPFPVTFATELVLYKFAPDGEQVYRRAFPAGPGGVAYDLSVDAEGRVYVAGVMNAITDFGGGSLGFLPSSFHSFLLALDQHGEHRETLANVGIYRMTEAADELVYTSDGLKQFDIVAALLGLGSSSWDEPDMIALNRSSLNESWRRPVVYDENYPWMLDGLPDGTLVGLSQLSESHTNDAGTETITRNSVRILRYDSSGNYVGRVDSVVSEDRSPLDDAGAPEDLWILPPQLSRLETAASGELALAGIYYSDLTVGDVTLVAGAQPDRDQGIFYSGGVLFAKLDAGHELQWLRTVRAGERPEAQGLALDSDGNVWAGTRGAVEGTFQDDEPEFEQDIVISKLRSAP